MADSMVPLPRTLDSFLCGPPGRLQHFNHNDYRLLLSPGFRVWAVNICGLSSLSKQKILNLLVLLCEANGYVPFSLVCSLNLDFGIKSMLFCFVTICVAASAQLTLRTFTHSLLSAFLCLTRFASIMWVEGLCL